MREENKLNKAIKQDGIETQKDILDELKRRYPQYVGQSGKKQAPVRKRRIAVISALAAVVACVAIIVPCAVLLPNRNNSPGAGKNNDRYCTQKEYEKSPVQYTIKEYRENHKLNFLYFDWYELGEGRETVCFISNVDNEVLCLEEQVYLPEKDEFVQLSITKSNVYLSEFDATRANCTGKQTVYNHTVKFDVTGTVATGIIEDNGYRYFVQVFPVQDEESLFDKVKELLEKN